MDNVRITYLYRDGANYKFWGDFVLKGALSISELLPFFISELASPEEHYFLPYLINLPDLIPTKRNEDDLLWHSIDAIEPTDDTNYLMTSKEFLSLFKTAHSKNWPYSEKMLNDFKQSLL